MALTLAPDPCCNAGTIEVFSISYLQGEEENTDTQDDQAFRINFSSNSSMEVEFDEGSGNDLQSRQITRGKLRDSATGKVGRQAARSAEQRAAPLLLLSVWGGCWVLCPASCWGALFLACRSP